MTRYWAGALLFVAALLLATHGALQRLRTDAERTVAEQYQTQQRLLVASGSAQLSGVIERAQRVLEAGAAEADPLQADALADAELKAGGVMFLVHDGDGHVLSVSSNVPEPMASKMLSHSHRAADGAWDETVDYCPVCLSAAHRMAVSVPAQGGRYLGALLDSEHLYATVLAPMHGDHHGYFWGLHRDGTVMLSPDPSLIGTRPFVGLAPDDPVRVVIDAMLGGEAGVGAYAWMDPTPTERLAAYGPLEPVAASLAYSADRASVITRISDLQRNGIRTVRWLLLTFGAAALLVALGAVVHLRRERQARQQTEEASRRRRRVQEALLSAQEELLESSRKAAIAEVATGVLHNVANVTTAVNVSAQLLQEQLEQRDDYRLAEVVAMLHDNAGRLDTFLSEDPKGQRIPAYLDRVSKQIRHDQAQLRREAGRLLGHLEHVREVIRGQQDQATGRAVGAVSVAEVVDQATALASAALDGVAVERDLVPVYVRADGYRVVQILVNLLVNAAAALEGCDGPPQVKVSAVCHEGRVRIAVCDNGPGISPEHLERLFSYGFTTKQDGHGFGLHHSARAASDMGGKLSADSDGPGCGATFVLELPLADVTTTPRPAPPVAARSVPPAPHTPSA